MAGWLGLVGVVAALAGTIASLSSAGVDSLVTPVLSLGMDMRTAVLAATAPHIVFNATRFWTVRHHLQRELFKRFGMTSAAGSLVGSLLHQVVSSTWMTVVFAGLLIVAGALGVTGSARPKPLGERVAYLAGGVSGFFGGLTGEQGGLRAAALLGFGCPKESFLATATATALVVDAVRLPIYLGLHWSDFPKAIGPALVSVAGVVAGIFVGKRLLEKVPEDKFSRVVSGALLLIGTLMVLRLFVKK